MSDTPQAMTVIGPDTHIKGEMVFDSSARILGSFEGRITAKGEVEIGEGAACKASIEATAVIVDGLVEGDITARERAHLNPKARVVGDIVATTLAVAEGASFVGHCRVGADALNQTPPHHHSSHPASTPTTARRSEPTETKSRNKPVVVAQVSSTSLPTTPVTTKTADIEATLAGLEARLAGLGRSRSTSHAHAAASPDNAAGE